MSPFSLLLRGGQGPAILHRLWGAIIGPLLAMLMGTLALRMQVSWQRILGANLILLASPCLWSFIVMLVTSDDAGWLGHWLKPSWGLICLRISLSILVGLLILFTNYWTFYRLFQAVAGTWITALDASRACFSCHQLLSFYSWPPDLFFGGIFTMLKLGKRGTI